VKGKKRITAAFTLYETLVTLALFSLLMTMITAIFVNTTRVHRSGIEMARLREKANNALDVICTDLSKAFQFDFANPDNIQFKITDPHRSDITPTSGGALTVTYYLKPTEHIILRADKYSSTVIADQVSRLNFSVASPYPPFFVRKVDIEVKANVLDPTSRSYSLNADISPRCHGGFQDFGP
jgi:hypothetical protein